MNINRQDKYLILIKFKIKIQFVMFMRGHLWIVALALQNQGEVGCEALSPTCRHDS